MLDQYPQWVTPIGLAADINGYLYLGLYNGSAVIKIDPKIPAVIDHVHLPTPYITTPTFGGPNNDILFVTSGTLPVHCATNRVGRPLTRSPAGDLFMIRGWSKSKGVPSYRPYL